MPDIYSVVGGDAGFETLYLANVRALLAYALRRVERPEDAADVVADTMLVAWRRIDMVPPGDEARLWLFGVAHRVLANQRRGARRREHLGNQLRQSLRGRVDPDHAAAVAAGHDMRAALDALPAGDRELMRLVSWEGLTPEEIATVLDLSPGTARTRLFRARARLRQLLDDGARRPQVAGHAARDGRPPVRQTEGER